MNTKMKKSTCYMGCLFVAFMLFSLGAKAQSTPNYGLKGGLNVSNFYVEDIDDKNARLGFHLGLYGQLFATDFFALQPEINYSMRGNEVISDGLFDQKTRFNLNYIDVPVLAVFKLGDALEIHAGVYGAYLVGASIKSEGDLGDWFDELNRDNFESFDYGLSGGLGLNFGAVQIGARYNLGLVEIARSDQARTVLGDSKNSLGQLYIALRLND
ncbi:MAG: PorT family protein [Cyclobacteriaceae bacterium]|nr:PorT family protein [Cyclobacteriaceae bacterium]